MNCGYPSAQRSTSDTFPFIILLPHWIHNSAAHCLSLCWTRGKTAWEIWQVYPDVLDAFVKLVTMPSKLSEQSLALLEWIAVLLSYKTSECIIVNEARKDLFTHQSRTLETFPQPKLCCNNKSNEHAIKPIDGTKVWFLIQKATI